MSTCFCAIRQKAHTEIVSRHHLPQPFQLRTPDLNLVHLFIQLSWQVPLSFTSSQSLLNFHDKLIFLFPTLVEDLRMTLQGQSLFLY
jgi:hypothetical protein